MIVLAGLKLGLWRRLGRTRPGEGHLSTDFLLADNAAFYGENQIPFVMGTTGGDREKLIADTLASGTYAVIAPQMGKQVLIHLHL